MKQNQILPSRSLLGPLILLAGFLPWFGVALAASQPTWMTVTPSSVTQGQCYLIRAGNAAYMRVDLRYQLNNGPIQTIIGWPTLDLYGRTNVCTSSTTALGTYRWDTESIFWSLWILRRGEASCSTRRTCNLYRSSTIKLTGRRSGYIRSTDQRVQQ